MIGGGPRTGGFDRYALRQPMVLPSLSTGLRCHSGTGSRRVCLGLKGWWCWNGRPVGEGSQGARRAEVRQAGRGTAMRAWQMGMHHAAVVVPPGRVVAARSEHSVQRWFEPSKRFVDVVLGAIALVVSLPLLAICAVVIKLSSRGPVIYTQTRVGKDGVRFKMYKLRTMYADAESVIGPVWSSHDDPRVVPSCRWMRRIHVDELPQLVNVLKGEMSLVGPRPERPEMMAILEVVYPDFRKRLVVRPGITGLAQVRNGYDGSVEGARRKLRADLEYIARRTWSMELWILAGTIAKLLRKCCGA